MEVVEVEIVSVSEIKWLDEVRLKKEKKVVEVDRREREIQAERKL